MPRAKRTDRAEARRRHRASLDASEGTEDVESSEPDDEQPAGRGKRPSEPRPGTRAARPSITGAFRSAFHPLTLREDLRTFPPLLAHRSVWLPSLLTIAAGVWFLATDGGNVIAAIIATYFVAPPALGSVFLAGFMAPRSSYLIGFVVGLVSAAVASAIILSSSTPLVPGGNGTAAASPSPSVAVMSPSPIASGPAASPGASASVTPGPAASPSPGTDTPSGVSTQDQIIYAFVTSPPFGMFFAAAAAWYRRFLRLSNPNRGRPPERRGPDGRSRAKGGQRPAGRR